MELCSTPAVPILEDVLAAFVCGTSVSPQPRTYTTSEDTSMKKFSAAHVLARLTCRAAHMSLAPRNHPGTPPHGLPAQLTPRYPSERQPRPARLLCPPSAIVSVFHMFARLTCRRGSHVSDAEISFGTSVHGLPASTDAELSERQRTACPHCDSKISCGVSHTVWFQSLLARNCANWGKSGLRTARWERIRTPTSGTRDPTRIITANRFSGFVPKS